MPFPIPPLEVTLHPIDPPSAEPREQAAVLDAVDGQSLTLTVDAAAVIESLAEWAKALRDRVAQRFYRIHGTPPLPAEPVEDKSQTTTK